MSIRRVFQVKMNRLTFLFGFFAAVLVFNIQNVWEIHSNVVAAELIVLALDLISLTAVVMLFLGRLRDLHKSPMWLFVLPIPVVNMGLLMYCIFKKGDPTTKPYWLALMSNRPPTHTL